MVVRIVKLSLIHKIIGEPFFLDGQERFLAKGLLSRLETRRKLILFASRYRDP